MTLGLDRIIDHTALGLTNEDLIDLYRKMLISRRLDEKMWALNRQGRVPFVVSVSGHEATQIGVAAALDPLDGEAEEAAVRAALERAEGDKNAAARDLGISYRTLQRRIKQYDLEGYPVWR